VGRGHAWQAKINVWDDASLDMSTLNSDTPAVACNAVHFFFWLGLLNGGLHLLKYFTECISEHRESKLELQNLCEKFNGKKSTLLLIFTNIDNDGRVKEQLLIFFPGEEREHVGRVDV